jgi:hypothetical protein
MVIPCHGRPRILLLIPITLSPAATVTTLSRMEIPIRYPAVKATWVEDHRNHIISKVFLMTQNLQKTMRCGNGIALEDLIRSYPPSRARKLISLLSFHYAKRRLASLSFFAPSHQERMCYDLQEFDGIKTGARRTHLRCTRCFNAYDVLYPLIPSTISTFFTYGITFGQVKRHWTMVTVLPLKPLLPLIFTLHDSIAH